MVTSMLARLRQLRSVLATLASTILITAAIVVLAPAQPAAAATTTMSTTTVAKVTTIKPNWTDLTCHAVEAFTRHHDAQDLTRMATYAAHLTGRSWLRSDVYDVLSTATSPSAKARQHLDTALQYAGEDCFGGA